MIRLEVKDYCHSCSEFNPDIKYPTNFYADGKVVMMTDTLVRCKDRCKCENLKCHIKKELGETNL